MTKRLALVLALALAFAPLAWERLLLPSAEAQFQAFQQAKTLQNAVGANGNGDTLDTSGNPIVAFQLSGTFVASVTFEGSLDGSTFANLHCYPIGSSTGTNSAIAPGIWRCNVVGIPIVRARVHAWVSGSVTVKALATQSYFPLGTNVP
jgi:hypothetical protein